MTPGYEQAVYGSFPFWSRGYAVLAQSAGCRSEWLHALKLAGQRFGERPTGIAEKACLFALGLPRGPWMIVGVFPQGNDDQGRPGALAFHGLFVSRWTYRWSGASPFAFASALRSDWGTRDQDQLLPAGRIVLGDRQPPATGDENGRVETIVEAIKRGQKVVLVSAQPIDELASAVWRKLPGRVRRRASVATWAFSTANGFDLVAVPRLAGMTLDPSMRVLEPDAETVQDWPSSCDFWHAEDRAIDRRSGLFMVTGAKNERESRDASSNPAAGHRRDLGRDDRIGCRLHFCPLLGGSAGNP